jgi:hypothetical protein
MPARLDQRKRVSTDKRATLREIKTAPDPWAAANSRLAYAVQEMNRARGNARSAYLRHDDSAVRSEMKTVVTLAKRIMIISENMPV